MIDGIKFNLKSIQPIKSGGIENADKISGNEQKPSFSNFLKDAISEVNTLQNDADQQIEGLVLNKPGVTTHDAMIALEKADVAFQMMNTIRGKIIRAYEEVMRTQI